MLLKIGHRGAPTLVPENTVEGFHKAAAFGVHGVEFDIHLCSSGEPVVIHDDTVDRTTYGTGKVAKLTLKQLRKLEVRGGGYIPTLAEVFDVLGEEFYYFIEIKAAKAAIPVAKMVSGLVKKGWKAERLTIISFQHEALQAVKRKFPALCIGASFEELKAGDIAIAKKIGAGAIVPHYKEITVKDIQEAHKAGLKVIVWTVNETPDIIRMGTMGVDGIISDHPERL